MADKNLGLTKEEIEELGIVDPSEDKSIDDELSDLGVVPVDKYETEELESPMEKATNIGVGTGIGYGTGKVAEKVLGGLASDKLLSIFGPLHPEQLKRIQEERKVYKSSRPISELVDEYKRIKEGVARKGIEAAEKAKEATVGSKGLTRKQLEESFDRILGPREIEYIENVAGKGKPPVYRKKTRLPTDIETNIEPFRRDIRGINEIKGEPLHSVMEGLKNQTKQATGETKAILGELQADLRTKIDPSISDLKKTTETAIEDENELKRLLQISGDVKKGDIKAKATTQRNLLKYFQDPELFKEELSDLTNVIKDQGLLTETEMSSLKDLAKADIGGKADLTAAKGLSITNRVINIFEKLGGKVQEKTALMKSSLFGKGAGKLRKSLGPIGALIGAAVSYQDAKAAGMEPAQAAARAIEEESVGFAAPEVGPSIGTPERVFEMGETGDYKQLLKQYEETQKRLTEGDVEPSEPVQNIQEIYRQYTESYPQKFQKRVQALDPKAQEVVQKQVEQYENPDDRMEEAKAEFNIQQQPALKRLLERKDEEEEI